MLAFERDGDELEQPLDRPYPCWAARDVIRLKADHAAAHARLARALTAQGRHTEADEARERVRVLTER